MPEGKAKRLLAAVLLKAALFVVGTLVFHGCLVLCHWGAAAALATPMLGLVAQMARCPVWYLSPGHGMGFAMALCMPVAAIVAGLVTARLGRAFGAWRLVLPVLPLLYYAYHTERVTRLIAKPTAPEHMKFDPVALLHVGFHLTALAALLAIIPAVVAVWLGCKLWPWPATAAPPPPLEAGESDVQEREQLTGTESLALPGQPIRRG